jgi:hypothetical protein
MEIVTELLAEALTGMGVYNGEAETLETELAPVYNEVFDEESGLFYTAPAEVNYTSNGCGFIDMPNRRVY